MSDTPEEYAIEIRRGETFTLPMTYATQDDAGTVTPQVFTGWHARMQVKPDADAPQSTAIVTLDSTTHGAGNAYGSLILGAAGAITVSLTAATTQALKARTAAYDLKLTRPDGSAFFLIEGECKILPTVTRDA